MRGRFYRNMLLVCGVFYFFKSVSYSAGLDIKINYDE